jgi:hypothetical protein
MRAARTASSIWSSAFAVAGDRSENELPESYLLKDGFSLAREGTT